MTYFIDRRLNPKGKSLANRQRFLRRARAQIREAVQKVSKDSGVADVAKDRKIRISTQGTREPRFRLDPKKAGARDFVAARQQGLRAGRPDQEAHAGRGRPRQGRGDARARARTISSSPCARTRSSTSSSRTSSCPIWCARRSPKWSPSNWRRAGFTHVGLAQPDQSRPHDAQFLRPPACAEAPDAGRRQGAAKKRSRSLRRRPRRTNREDPRAEGGARTHQRASANGSPIIDPLGRALQQPSSSSPSRPARRSCSA